MKTKNYILWLTLFIAILISNCNKNPSNTINNTPPVLTKISTKSTLVKDILGEIIFYFDEEVTGFTTNDIILSGFNLEGKNFITNSKKEYIWKVTPRESGKLNITVTIFSFEDLDGNLNKNYTTTSFSVIELTPPTVNITGFYLAENAEGKIIFDFNKNVNNFTKSDIKFSDPAPTTGDFNPISKNSYELIVTPLVAGTLTVKIDADSFEDIYYNSNEAISNSLTVDDSVAEEDLKGIITAGNINSDRSTLQGIAKDIASYYTNEDSPAVVARYVRKDGTGDGSSWNKATNDLKNTINGINDASSSKIYLVLVASGIYPSDNIAMKNHVAIVGGWHPIASWERSGETQLSGQNKKRVFNNTNLNHTALLYSATITKGFIGDSSSNAISSYGAGMFNYDNASPSLENVTFLENRGGVIGSGAGMANRKSSSPTLKNVTFLRNTSGVDGGGMYNFNSSPTLVNVTFSGNEAVNGRGGGMYNLNSYTRLINVTFSGNIANKNGGGVYVNYTLNDNPLLVNTIFWGNQAKGSPNQISFYKSAGKLSLHYSIIEGGTNNLSKNLISSHITYDDPMLSPLAENGGLVQTHALGTDSPAINAGAYVKKSGNNFYFSINQTTWYTGFDKDGLKTTATPPGDAEDLIATDARGYIRTDRPDIGAYESGGIAP